MAESVSVAVDETCGTARPHPAHGPFLLESGGVRVPLAPLISAGQGDALEREAYILTTIEPLLTTVGECRDPPHCPIESWTGESIS